MALLDPDRLFPVEPKVRGLAREIYDAVADLPIISPHGHCDPRWFAENDRFPDPARLFVVPDHYLFRMLVSQGVRLEDLGVPRVDGGPVETDPRAIWRRFAENVHLFRGTPTGMWLAHSFEHVFGLDEPLSAATAEMYFDHIDACLDRPEYRPRALFERFGIEALATTDSALDDLRFHRPFLQRLDHATPELVLVEGLAGPVGLDDVGRTQRRCLIGVEAGIAAGTLAPAPDLESVRGQPRVHHPGVGMIAEGAPHPRSARASRSFQLTVFSFQ